MRQHRFAWSADAHAPSSSEMTDLVAWIAVLTAILFMILVVAALAMQDARPGDQPSLIEPAAWSTFTA